MKITTQFPIVDCRGFLHRSYKLPKPYFVSPDIRGGEYIRYFGEMRGRYFQDYHYFAGENTFCNATHALKFTRPESFFRDKVARPQFVERRFYSDGNNLGKFEVKTSYRFRPDISPLPDEGLFTAVLNLHFDQIVMVNDRKGGSAPYPLLQAGPALADLYLHGSTGTAAAANVKKYWVRDGQSIIVVEYNTKLTPRSLSAPPDAAGIVLSDDWLWDEQYMTLRHYHYRGVPCWIITTFGEDPTTRRLSRNLKTLLLRIHAEKQSLIRALEFLSINSGNDALDTKRATAFIRNTLNRLLKERRFNTPQGSLVNAAFESDDQFSAADHSKLRQVLLDLNNKYIVEDFDCLFAQIDFDNLRSLLYDSEKQGKENGLELPPELNAELGDIISDQDKSGLKKFIRKHRNIIDGCTTSVLVEALKWIGSSVLSSMV